MTRIWIGDAGSLLRLLRIDAERDVVIIHEDDGRLGERRDEVCWW